MSRSKHNGCGRAKCGMCKPHKKWKTNSPKNEKVSVQKRLHATEAA